MSGVYKSPTQRAKAQDGGIVIVLPPDIRERFNQACKQMKRSPSEMVAAWTLSFCLIGESTWAHPQAKAKSPSCVRKDTDDEI